MYLVQTNRSPRSPSPTQIPSYPPSSPSLTWQRPDDGSEDGGGGTEVALEHRGGQQLSREGGEAGDQELEDGGEGLRRKQEGGIGRR